jgi:hypothetical protein
MEQSNFVKTVKSDCYQTQQIREVVVENCIPRSVPFIVKMKSVILCCTKHLTRENLKIRKNPVKLKDIFTLGAL